MRNMTLERIAEVCGGAYIGDENKKQLEVAGIVIDSRQVKTNDLFIPIRGKRADGHTFIPSVFEKGAAAVLSEKQLKHPSGPYIRVSSCEEALTKLAAFYRQQFEIPVVGVTGSVGKTSTKEMIASVLAQKYNVFKTEANHNNRLGLSLMIFRLRDEHEAAVLEMGISDFGEMDELASLANPNVCVITNIGPCHLEHLSDRDGVLAAKTECFAHMREGGVAILNGDDDKLSLISSANGNTPVFYGLGEQPKEGCRAKKTVYASDLRGLGLDGTKARFHIGEDVFEAVVPIPGEHNVYNALAAACVGIRLGLSPEEIRAGIEAAGTISGRNNMIRVRDLLVIDDCYNANPVSMKASLDVLSQAPGRRIAVLGDMGELGPREKELHYEVGAYLAGKKIDALFTSGVLSGEIVRGAKEHGGNLTIRAFDTREEMTKNLLAFVRPGDSVLVKASHFMDYPKVVEAICGDRIG